MSRTAGEIAHRGQGLQRTVGSSTPRSRLRIRGFGAGPGRKDDQSAVQRTSTPRRFPNQAIARPPADPDRLSPPLMVVMAAVWISAQCARVRFAICTRRSSVRNAKNREGTQSRRRARATSDKLEPDVSASLHVDANMIPGWPPSSCGVDRGSPCGTAYATTSSRGQPFHQIYVPFSRRMAAVLDSIPSGQHIVADVYSAALALLIGGVPRGTRLPQE